MPINSRIAKRPRFSRNSIMRAPAVKRGEHGDDGMRDGGTIHLRFLRLRVVGIPDGVAIHVARSIAEEACVSRSIDVIVISVNNIANNKSKSLGNAEMKVKVCHLFHLLDHYVSDGLCISTYCTNLYKSLVYLLCKNRNNRTMENWKYDTTSFYVCLAHLNTFVHVYINLIYYTKIYNVSM